MPKNIKGYRGVNFTTSWFEDGESEVGSHCCEKYHRTPEGAERCIWKQAGGSEQAGNLHGGGHGVREYDAENRYRAVEREEMSF